jgi:chemotaxis protein histidine kinase CheA
MNDTAAPTPGVPGAPATPTDASHASLAGGDPAPGTPGAAATPSPPTTPSPASNAPASDAGTAAEANKGTEAGETKPGEKPEAAKAPESYDLKLADDSPLDQADVDAVAETAKQLGLTQKQAETLLERQAEAVSAYQQRQVAAHQEQTVKWVDDVRADPEIGGDKFDASVNHARAALDAFGTPEFKQALNDSGFGNHPMLVKFCARVGAAIGEDKIVNPNRAGGGPPKSRAEILYGGTQ